MIVLVVLILALTDGIRCQIGSSCSYGGEACTCKGGSAYLTITCTSNRSSQSGLPSEFRSLSLSVKYTIVYQNKNMPFIGVNSSLPKLQLESLDFASNKIKIIEQGVFDKTVLKKMDLSYNSLINLDFLTPLCDLEKLTLDENKVDYLNASWFKCKTKMTELSITKNIIRIVGSRMFYGLTKLTTINLLDNKIETIESESFSNLPKLSSLSVCSPNIREIKPYAFSNLSSLPSIGCLAKQSIESLPRYSFFGLPQLGSLSFEGNQLTSLLKDTFIGLNSITGLTLENNLLQEIEVDVFSQMPRLNNVYLSKNKLSKIQRDIFSSLKALITLKLDQNRIDTIEPDSLCQSIEDLNLAQNKLEAVKKSYFLGVKALQRLDLSNNHISAIETGSFDNSVNLLELKLDNNCIFSIHQDMFKYLPKMYLLTISNNVILKLSPLIFGNLSKLTQLDLSFNQIDSLPDFIFQDLNKLQTLDLSNNRLKRLDSPLVFQGLNSLQTFRLSDNLIQEVSFDLFSSFRQTLKKVVLDFNYLNDFKSSQNYSFPALSTLNLSSNQNLKNSTGLISTLERCSKCKYQLYFQSMSTEFIQEFIQYLSKSPPLAGQISLLDLSYNYLGSLFDLIPFAKMKWSLTALYLKNTNISLSFSILNQLQSIQEIDMSNQQIVFQGYIANSDIHTLYLSNTGITDIESELQCSSMNGLYDVDLSRNMIEVVKKSDFGFNEELSKLNISHNRIRFIENFAFRPNVLIDLDLTNNLLESFSDSLFYYEENSYFMLSNLRLSNNRLNSFVRYRSSGCLNLEDNYLQDMFDIYSSGVTSLNMDRNNLSWIGNVISNNILELTFASNKIAQIKANTFSTCCKLIKLDLSLNMIRNISKNTFTGLNSLATLNLSSNLIEYINQDVFWHLNKLIELDLNNNKIKLIMDMSFSNLNSLQKLYLNSLEMTNITNQTFEGLRSLSFLEMTSNQFELIQNINTTINSLSKEYKSKNERYTWYSSTFIKFKQPTTRMKARYCSMVLYFAKSNILINILTDLDQQIFVSACRSYYLADLEYHKFGFD